MESKEDLGRRFPLIPLTNSTLPLDAKRPRDVELEHESMSQLRRRVRESAPTSHTGIPKTRDSARDLAIPTKPRVA